MGGVNSPVRSFKGVGRDNPIFISKGKGSKIYDEDGNSYIDYVCSWGASILGSAKPSVVKAVKAASNRGLSFGAATRQETALAERVQKSFPSMELMRFVSSGTEATMASIRAARAFTKKSKVIKFDGCYHGHSDGFLVRGGSGLATYGIADSAGVPESIASETLVARFNDLETVRSLLEQNKGQVAAVIVEPIAANMCVVPPLPGFLQGLRNLSQEQDCLLIFDEIITGFRVARGGCQSLYNVKPDLTCLGKVVGGGMNIAAYGGRKDVMELVSPLGPVYQAGTLAGNPIAVAAGIATLDALRPPAYSKLEQLSKRLENGLLKQAEEKNVRIRIQRAGSMIGLFFLREGFEQPSINSYEDVKSRASQEQYSRFFNILIEKGVYLPPSAFETIFVSTAHSNSDIKRTLQAAGRALDEMRT